MKFSKIEGLIAAPFTPMKPDGSLNLYIIEKYAKKLIADSVKGVFICGTTGEGMLMTNEERKEVTEKWITEKSSDFKIIVHVGTTSAKQSFDLANHAQNSGANAISCIGPVFLKPLRVEELISYCSEVAAGAPELPFYYYHIPSVSGVNLPMSEFAKQAATQIPNFVGIKFTDNNFMEMQQCINQNEGKWDILHGYDEQLLAGLLFGASGAVGSTYNFMAPLYNGIIRDFNKGNIISAREKQLKSVKIITILNQYGGAIVAGKRLMKTIGIDCGNFRLPVSKFNEDRYDQFINDLENEEFFKIISF